jgi:hypothetical protein
LVASSNLLFASSSFFAFSALAFSLTSCSFGCPTSTFFGSVESGVPFGAGASSNVSLLPKTILPPNPIIFLIILGS